MTLHENLTKLKLPSVFFMKTKKIENYLLTANKVKKTDDNIKM